MTRGTVNYSRRGTERPRYYANDHSRDLLFLDPTEVEIADGRAAAPSLDREGIALVPHETGLTDLADPSSGPAHAAAIRALVARQTGADLVVVSGHGILRFAESSGRAGSTDNSFPARFVHVDVSAETAARFAARSRPEGCAEPSRYAHINIWRCLSAPPQDVPLAVCDARSVEADDLVPAEAVFDAPGKPEWSFEGLVIAANPRHRWLWFPDMHPGEALLFKTFDSDPAAPRCVPHSAFDAAVPPGTPPRASIEMRAVAYWF